MILDGSSPFLIASWRISRLSPVIVWASSRVRRSLLLSSVVVILDPWLSIARVKLPSHAPRGAINVLIPRRMDSGCWVCDSSDRSEVRVICP